MDEINQDTDEDKSPTDNSDIGSRLRKELKKLLGSPDFQTIQDLDQMTDILMQKLAEIADEDDIDEGLTQEINRQTLNSQEDEENVKTFVSYEITNGNAADVNNTSFRNS